MRTRYNVSILESQQCIMYDIIINVSVYNLMKYFNV